MSRIAFVPLFAALLVGCADEGRVADGPGSETSGFAARVLDARGRPTPGVWVRAVGLEREWLRDASRGRDPVLARVVSDSEGWAKFGNLAASRVALEIDDPLQAGRIEVDGKAARGSDLNLVQGGALRLRAAVPGETVQKVFLAGTAYSASPNSTGAWVLLGVAPGWYSVAARTDSGMSLLGDVQVGSGASIDTALSADMDSVLLEDFSAPIGRNRYGRLLGAGWWYTTTDLVYGGGSTTLPADPYGARVACPDGNCLGMEFRIDADGTQRFALVGLDLDWPKTAIGEADHLADLSKVSAIRFGADGRGTFSFQLHFATPSGYRTCSAPFAVDSVWTRHDIPISSLVCDGATPVDRAKAIGITFLTQSDARLRLGRIILSGAGPRRVFRDLAQGAVP